MEDVQVSIIIINYNTRQMTQECINSVIEKTIGVSYEIIVIDNRSDDDSKQYLENDNRIRYVYSFENLGFGRANNLGMTLSKGDYIFLLNSDTLLVNNAIKMLYDYAERRKGEIAFYGGWLLDYKMNYIHSFAEIATMKLLLKNALATYSNLFKTKKEPTVNEMYKESAESIEVGYVTGADMFYHRSIFEKYGGFDYRFFMYYEECDWQWRMKQHGIKSIILKGPEIIHLYGQRDGKPFKARSVRARLMIYDSMKYYLKKHYGKVQCFLFRIAYFILKFLPIIFDRRYYKFSERIRILSKIAI